MEEEILTRALNERVRGKQCKPTPGRSRAGSGGRRGSVRLAAMLALPLLASGLVAQTSGIWTVRPEWVRAHEEFLASDVLAGRGSATRDEQIAATYVASEFLTYGLEPAPGMKDFLQAAEIVSPSLDGHATLRVGSIAVEEGKGMRLLLSTGEPVRGPVGTMELDKPLPQALPRGAVLLASGSVDVKRLGETVRAARKAGVAALIVTEGAGTVALTDQWGGGVRLPKRLAEVPARPGVTLVAVTDEQMQRMRELGGAQVATLAVQPVPQGPQATYNAIGYLPGSDPASGTLLLTAHLDHLGIGKPVNGDAIYNGANDDAAGTTAVLELAHALASGKKLRRNVLFVCYGSEEAGELGSEYFGRHSPVPLKELIANLEFEMIGTQDPKMPAGTLLLTGWERSDLGPTLKAHGALLGPDPYPEQHFFERSDNYQLALQGVVAHTVAGYGMPATYHQPSDDLRHLDLNFMTTAIQSFIEPVRWLAGSDFKPAWTKDGQPHR